MQQLQITSFTSDNRFLSTPPEVRHHYSLLSRQVIHFSDLVLTMLGYQEIVQLLLEVPTVLVSSPDLSLGTVYDLALERYAMVDNQIMKNAFKEILQLLAPHFNVSAQDIKYIDDKEAKERRKERERRLRERISVAKQLEEQKKHHQNQELVDRNYTPLNFNLFAGILNDEAFHPEFVGAMKSCDFSEVIIALKAILISTGSLRASQGLWSIYVPIPLYGVL